MSIFDVRYRLRYLVVLIPLFHHFLVCDALVTRYMVGRFDNFEQSMLAEEAGMPTAAEGGHEYVTLNIIPHPSHVQVLIASYYYAKNHESPFRYRLVLITLNIWYNSIHV